MVMTENGWVHAGLVFSGAYNGDGAPGKIAETNLSRGMGVKCEDCPKRCKSATALVRKLPRRQDSSGALQE